MHLFAISSINRPSKGGRKRKQKKSNITKDRIEEIELYGGNSALPVYSKSRKVLSPAETVGLLTDRGGSRSSDPQDVKCDDMGSWRNNSSSKFTFDVEWNEGEIKMLTPVRKGCHKSSVILKREYFILNHDVVNDLRKRIDTIVCKYRTQ